jgi:flagellar biosynthetic protein FliQ
MSTAYQGMKVTLFLAGPLLITALSIGLLVSLFQAATQINEMTLSFIPKILGVFGALVLAGPWLLQLITSFTRDLFLNIPLMLG